MIAADQSRVRSGCLADGQCGARRSAAALARWRSVCAVHELATMKGAGGWDATALAFFAIAVRANDCNDTD